MRVLIDADILAYEFGNMKQLEDPEQPLAWEITRSLVDERVQQILEATKATSHSLYLTDSKSNFRNRVATILPYKGHRKTEKPYHWERIRQHLIDEWDAEVQYGIEADDRLGIEQYSSYKESAINPETSSTVICSRDKDLHMIPGWHYVWPCGNQQEKFFFQVQEDAIRHFYRQLLTGDRSTDNILGLYGVGASSKLVKHLDEIDTELEMFKHVLKCYEDRFGSYATQFMYETGALLWMLREEPRENSSTFENELYGRFNKLLAALEEEQNEYE